MLLCVDRSMFVAPLPLIFNVALWYGGNITSDGSATTGFVELLIFDLLPLSPNGRPVGRSSNRPVVLLGYMLKLPYMVPLARAGEVGRRLCKERL